tara:strand:+ start:2311 stop:2952 length:642 start_codon:yes stop_codon:yes gene_type:complete
MEKDETLINDELNDKNQRFEESKDKSEISQESKTEEENTELTLEDEVIVLKDKITRTYAEMENQRRRFEKEKEDAFDYGGFAFAKETLNVLDNLERSKISLENDDLLKNTDGLKKLVEHINIINDDMMTIFKKNNIEPIKAINEKLDPNLHQAMLEIEDDTKDVGTIVQEIQKGFMMKNRLLRPSLVAVSKKKVDSEIKSEKNQQNQEKNEKK